MLMDDKSKKIDKGMPQMKAMAIKKIDKKRKKKGQMFGEKK